ALVLPLHSTCATESRFYTIPTLDEVLTTLTARLEYEKSPGSAPTEAQTQTIGQQQAMLEQNLNQLTVQLQAIEATQDRPGR
ncbi:hypothetical protein, partial [Brevibacterium aurantiacum]|uniref:hypothetical protein n=1 Tax=Brevibacterium aurantiacum TaxID=273384 RepID=UPI001D03725E